MKSLFQKLKVDAKVIELDSLADGNDVQQALFEVVGKKTVPQVFVGGQHIGGCDGESTRGSDEYPDARTCT